MKRTFSVPSVLDAITVGFAFILASVFVTLYAMVIVAHHVAAYGL